MANGLLAKNGLIVTGSVEVQNAVTASTFSGDGSGLSGVSDFPYTGSAVISGSLEVTGSATVKGDITSTSVIKADSQIRLGPSLYFIYHPQRTTGFAIGSSGNSNFDNGISLGGSAGRFASGQSNVSIGVQAGYRTSYGHRMVAIGDNANSGNSSYLKTDSIGIGSYSATNGGIKNVAIGAYSGNSGVVTNYSQSVFIGYNAGGFGSNHSVFLGYQAGREEINSQRLHIANTGSKSLIYGEFDNDLVRINGKLYVSNSLDVTGSVSASTYYGDGSNLTGISSDPFPYTGSAVISGSLEVTGSTKILAPNSLTGNYNFQLVTPQGWQFRAENDGNIRMGARGSEYVKWDFNAGNRVLNLNNFLIQGTSVYDLRFQAGTNANMLFGAAGSFSFGQTYNQGKAGLRIRQSNTNFPNSEVNTFSFSNTVNHLQPYTVIQTNDSSYGGNTTPQGHPLYLYTGQNTSTGTFGHLILQSSPQNGKKGNVGIGLEDPQTSLHVSGAVSASTYYGDGSNLTGIETDPFPYTGSAVISGSLTVTGSFNASGSEIDFTNLPTTDPGVAGRLFQTGSDAIGATAGFQVVCISQG